MCFTPQPTAIPNQEVEVTRLPEHLEALSEDEKIQLIARISEFADLYVSCATDRTLAQTGCNMSSVNPGYQRTRAGFTLEFWGPTPWTISTPWGFWHFGTDATSVDVHTMMSHLTTSLVSPSEGLNGYENRYRVLAVDGISVPPAVLIEDDLWLNQQVADAVVADWVRLRGN